MVLKQNSVYHGRNLGQDFSVLFVLLSEARLQPSHLLFELGDCVFLVHIHRLQHLQLCTQFSVLQLPVFQMNLKHTHTQLKNIKSLAFALFIQH